MFLGHIAYHIVQDPRDGSVNFQTNNAGQEDLPLLSDFLCQR
jgi:hypothetical protein